MRLKDWLLQERGRGNALAAFLRVSKQRMSQMSTDGVPTKYMLKVSEFTGGAVTLEEMVAARTPAPELAHGTSEEVSA